MRKVTGITVLATIGTSVLLPQMAIAQLEEVIVTAQKRGENLQDVPISVSVHTGDKLMELGLNDANRLTFVTPGLTIDNIAGQSNAFIRGVGAVTSTLGNESPVSTYVDGVYRAENLSLQQFRFLDIERIEVLKGPQGTLFGRNATGGAINIHTLAPAEEFSAAFEATYGRFDQRDFISYLTGPISDNLTGSISYGHFKSEGFWEHSLGLLSDADVGELETDQARVSCFGAQRITWISCSMLTITILCHVHLQPGSVLATYRWRPLSLMDRQSLWSPTNSQGMSPLKFLLMVGVEVSQ